MEDVWYRPYLQLRRILRDRKPRRSGSTPANPTPENEAIYARIAARRNPRPITKLDLALLHNPSIASGWNELLGAIRTKTSLSSGDTELAVCRVAVLNGAVYEWFAHAPLALKGGVSPSTIVRTVMREEKVLGLLLLNCWIRQLQMEILSEPLFVPQLCTTTVEHLG